jgi:hypothetical protein
MVLSLVRIVVNPLCSYNDTGGYSQVPCFDGLQLLYDKAASSETNVRPGEGWPRIQDLPLDLPTKILYQIESRADPPPLVTIKVLQTLRTKFREIANLLANWVTYLGSDNYAELSWFC